MKMQRLFFLTLVMGVTGGGSVFASAVSDTNDTGFWGVTNGLVRAVVRSGNVVYLGGDFKQLVSPGGNTVINVSGLAALNIDTGNPTSWRPVADGAVLALAAASDGSAIYVGGSFSNINGVARGRFAAISPTGSLLWAAHAGNTIKCLAVFEDTLFVGGSFTKIIGQTRLRLAAIQPPPPGGANGILLPWAPSLTSNDGTIPRVAGLALANGDVVAVGNWTHANGESESKQARFDLLTGELKPWKDHIDSPPECVTTDGVNFYGGFSGNGGKIVAWNFEGKRLWVAGANGDVQTVKYCQGQVIVGGHFTRILGIDVIRLAALWPNGTLDNSWYPNPNSGGDRGVWALDYSDKLYVGGGFLKIAGRRAREFARFNVVEDRPEPPGNLTASAPNPQQIQLNWIAPTGSVPATAYHLYRSGEHVASVGNVTGLTDTTVDPATTYSYVLCAIDASANKSDPSNMVLVTTPE